MLFIMATLVKQQGRKYYYAAYRDALGKQHLKSLKIKHTPEGRDPKERAKLAADNRWTATELANRIESAERGNATENHLRHLLAEISERLNGQKIDFPTVRSYLNEFLAARNLSEGTRVRYSKPIKDFISSLGPRAELPITTVTPADIDNFAAKRHAEGVAPSTVSVDVKALNVPFNAATRAGLLPWNPVARAAPIVSAKEQRQDFTRAEVESLIANAPDTEWRTMILLGAFAGMRISDAVRLLWEDVNMFAGEIKFRPQKTERKKRDLTLPMAKKLKAHLMTLQRPNDGKGLICPTLAARRTSGRSGLSLGFANIMNKAGIDRESIAGNEKSGRTFNRKSFHSLRHFFVSELERKGVAPDIRMKLAGHTTTAAHGRYTHTELETLKAAMGEI